MLDRNMTYEEQEEQAARYGHNWFNSRRQTPIRVTEGRTLRDAIRTLDQAYQKMKTARAHESGVCGADAYKLAQANTVDCENNYDDAKAEAEAAMYRETGMWPHQIYSLGLR
jgi:hypothetical protein